MKRVRLTKIGDHKFNGDHPHGVNPGDVREGMEMKAVQVGMAYWIEKDDGSWFHTSIVKEINDDTFVTLNSTYKIEQL